MTPELRTACEVVFQEHKLSQQIKWSKDSFRGQLSIGLTALAKETLVKKNIIILPNKSKKIITLLNPAVASASSFEEAEGMIVNKSGIIASAPAAPASSAVPVASTTVKNDPPIQPRPEPILMPRHAKQLIPVPIAPGTSVVTIKWYLKPMFFYIIWPLCAIVAGALISFLLDFAYSEIFLHNK